MSWDTVAIVASGLVGVSGAGTGVFVAWRNRKLPAAQHELAEDAARDAHWDTMMRTQLATLVEPLNKRMETMVEEQEQLKVEVRELRETLESQRTRYWGLVNYTRQVKLWILRHVPVEIHRQHPLPTTTEEIAADIAVDIP